MLNKCDAPCHHQDLIIRKEQLLQKLSDFSTDQLFTVVRSGLLEPLLLLLKFDVLNIDATDDKGRTALHIAAIEGSYRCASLLLAHGLNRYIVDGDGYTPLDLAVKHHHQSLVSLLSTQSSPTIPDEFCVEFSPADVDLYSVNDRIELNPQVVPSLETSLQHSQYSLFSQTKPLIICMVGLPGRGKSFIARHLCRHLRWHGVHCDIFNAGDYRRRLLGAQQTSDTSFFDAGNPENFNKREILARMATDDAIDFVYRNQETRTAQSYSAVAILDATNTTIKRREFLVTHCAKRAPSIRLLFLESVCNQQEVVCENILRAKYGKADFAHVTDPTTFIDLFFERIKEYEQVYETLQLPHDDEISFIKVIDGKVQMIFHRLDTQLMSLIGWFILQLHTITQPVFLFIPPTNTSLQDHQSQLELTENNFTTCESFREYISNFFRKRSEHILGQPLHVLFPTDDSLLNDMVPQHRSPRLKIEPDCTSSLNDISYGAFLQLSVSDARSAWPVHFHHLYGSIHDGELHKCSKDCACQFVERMNNLSPNDRTTSPTDENHHQKAASLSRPHYNVAFPLGESIRQVALRLEPVLIKTVSLDSPLLIFCGKIPAMLIASYLSHINPEELHTLDLPTGQLIEFTHDGNMRLHPV